uniref:EamA domain-containing protein n=1 Tax=Magnetococcus massalia (strain MO-1) TaxID=451514 RepID=A0A1S7LI75_MAGMO|nr:Conserved membrane protein of unknown function [Candidatus Magnetococcus massalia]
MSGVPLEQRLTHYLSPNVRGALWLVGAGLSFSSVGAMVKWAGSDLHPLQIVFIRCLFGLIILIPFFMRQGWQVLRSERNDLHTMRALVGIVAMSVTFYAYAKLPLAEVTALSFTNPLFMIPLAVLFLGEQVNWRRWLATGVGFLGVLVMVRPGSVPFNPDLWAAIASPFLIAIVRALIKRMTVTESTLTIVGRYAIASTLLSLPLALSVWQSPSMGNLLLMALASAMATLAGTMMVRAYAVGEATAITPFDYSRLLFATLFGMWLFGESASLWTWAGAAIVLLATLAIAKQEAAQPAPTVATEQKGA